MDAAIIVNPIAGRGRAAAVAEEAARALAEAGWSARVLPTERAGHAIELAARAAREASAIVVVGGDGTLREAAVGARGRWSDLAFGLVPMGTGNVVARELGLPLDPQRAVERLAGGAAPRRFDVGRVAADGGEPRAFLAMVGTGYDARVVARVERLRARRPETYAGHAVGAYARAGLAELAVPTRARAEVRAGGVPLAGTFDSVVVANTRTYGRGWSVAPRARADDGRLDVQAWPFALGAGSLTTMLCALMRRAAPRPFARKASGARIEISAARGVPWQADGDFQGEFECLDVGLEPEPLRILV